MMGENSNSDDDITGLFSQVASKLGWKSDEDLDAVLNVLSQSTKKKKKRKGSTKCQKKTTKAREARENGAGVNKSKTFSSKIKSSHREETSESQDLPRNDKSKKPHVKSSRSDDGVKINGTENALERPSDEYGREPPERRSSAQTSSYSGLIESVNGEEKFENTASVTRSGQTADCILKKENQESTRSKEESIVRRKTNISYEDGQNDSGGSAIFDSPLPRFLDFGGTPEESMVTKTINYESAESPEKRGCEDGDGDISQVENNPQTPQKSDDTAAPLSASFVDSPEPMHWFMSPQHKKKSQLSSIPPSHVIVSSSDEDASNRSHGIADVNHDAIADELPEFRVLSLTERLAQKHKDSKQKDKSPARKGRRKSCANPRSKSLILDKDWADDDDDDDEKDRDDDADVDGNDVGNDVEEEELEEDKNGHGSPDMRSNKLLESPADDRVKKKAVAVEKAKGNSFQNARLKYQDSSSDDDFESFLNAIKTPKHARGTGQDSDSDGVIEVIDDDDDDFIDDTPLKSSSDDDDDDVFYLKLINADNPLTSNKTRSIRKKRPTVGSRSGSVLGVVMVSDDDDDEDVFVLPKPTTSVRKEKPKVGISATTSKKTLSKPRHPLQTKSLSSNLTPGTTHTVQSKTDQPAPASFLRSLSTPGKGALPRSRYVSDFKRHKDELTQRLFRLYNESVFEKKLPADFSITWNNRMRKTAGFCFYKKRLGERTARIELSVKVCDTAERLRDTLIHEMCHAAAWLIHGVSDGHGKFWKYWAAKANLSHPEIPVIKRCHTYEIQTKFKYKCGQCGNIIGRHSKSINTERFCCALCNGRLELQPTLRKDGTPARPRGPNPFAAFVKENYASLKKTHGTAKHADVMRLLSQEFSSKAKITGS